MSGYSKSQVRRAGEYLRDLTDEQIDTDTDRLYAAIAAVEWWRGEHAKALTVANNGLRYWIRKFGVEPDITQRLKRFATIVDKLRRQPTMSLTTMEDIAGVRAILPTQEAVDAVAGWIMDHWEIRRVREYIAGRRPGPKNDGYRAVHLAVIKSGRYVEIQLRTPAQDAWAQSVEQDTRLLGHGLKFGSGPADLRDYYRVVGKYLELREQGLMAPDELDAELSRLFKATRAYYGPTGSEYR